MFDESNARSNGSNLHSFFSIILWKMFSYVLEYSGLDLFHDQCLKVLHRLALDVLFLREHITEKQKLKKKYWNLTLICKHNKHKTAFLTRKVTGTFDKRAPKTLNLERSSLIGKTSHTAICVIFSKKKVCLLWLSANSFNTGFSISLSVWKLTIRLTLTRLRKFIIRNPKLCRQKD